MEHWCPPLSYPANTYQRLSVIEAITGDPATTLRQEIETGRLQGKKRGKAWYTTLEFHREWVDHYGESVEEAEQGGGQTRANGERKMEDCGEGEFYPRLRPLVLDQDDGGGGVQAQTRASKRKRRSRSKVIRLPLQTAGRGPEEADGT